MSAIIEQEVASTQKLVEEGLRKVVAALPNQVIAPLSGLLGLISKYPDNVVEDTIGAFGTALQKYVKTLDVAHPSVIPTWQEFASSKLNEQMISALDVCEVAGKVKAEALMRFLRTEFGKRQQIRDLLNNQLHSPPIRAIKVREHRDYVREHGYSYFDIDEVKRKKKPVPFVYHDIHLLFKTEVFWQNESDTFTTYSRWNNCRVQLAERYKKYKAEFAEASLAHIAGIYADKANKLAFNEVAQYLGFFPIGVTNAAVILGKIYGFRCDLARNRAVAEPECVISRACYEFMRPNGYFVEKFMRGYDARVDESLDIWSAANSSVACPANISEQEKNVVVSDILSTTFGPFVYCPRMYPLNQVKDIAPESILEFVDLLEEFPDCNGKPAFDEYFVIIPSIDLDPLVGSLEDNSDKRAWRFKDKTFTSKEAASKHFDSHLVKQKVVTPILIGLCDNKYYFLSFFSDLQVKKVQLLTYASSGEL